MCTRSTRLPLGTEIRVRLICSHGNLVHDEGFTLRKHNPEADNDLESFVLDAMKQAPNVVRVVFDIALPMQSKH